MDPRNYRTSIRCRDAALISPPVSIKISRNSDRVSGSSLSGYISSIVSISRDFHYHYGVDVDYVW